MGRGGLNNPNRDIMSTPKNDVKLVGIAPRETGLGVSGQLVSENMMVTISCPSFTIPAGTEISFDDFVDLSAVEPDDIFVDSAGSSYTITEKPEFSSAAQIYKITLNSVAGINTAAGGYIYKPSQTASAMLVAPISVPGGGGLDVNIRDEAGNAFSITNPLPVQLSNGTVEIEAVQANVSVQLTHADDDPVAGRVHDSVRIGDGTDMLAINADGSINITDNGGSVTVDGSVSIVGPVTVSQPVSVDDNGGSLSVDDGGGSLTVDGSVSVVGPVTVAQPVETTFVYEEETKSVADTVASENLAFSADLKNKNKGSIHIVWSGLTNLTSTVHLEGSNDGGTSWDQINFSTVALNAASGNEMLLLDELFFENIRAVYTRTTELTGGSVDCYLLAKA